MRPMPGSRFSKVSSLPRSSTKAGLYQGKLLIGSQLERIQPLFVFPGYKINLPASS
jgi:hypothetical protein